MFVQQIDFATDDPDAMLALAGEWANFADRLMLAFPTDSADVLEDVGFELELVERLDSGARELGIFTSNAE